jgi:hypothetical protein
LPGGDPNKISTCDGDKQSVLSATGEAEEIVAVPGTVVEVELEKPRGALPAGDGVSPADKLLRKVAAASLAVRRDGEGVPVMTVEAVATAGGTATGFGIAEVPAVFDTRDANGFFKFTKFWERDEDGV